MRDPARIERMLELLRSVWAKHPDLRLGQLLDAARSNTGTRVVAFYVEDDELEKGLRIMDGWAPATPPRAP